MAYSLPQKLDHLSQGAVFDVTCADEKRNEAQICALKGILNLNGPEEAGRYPAGDPPGVSYVNNCGRQMPILKVLQTSHCEFNCKYCSFRRDMDRPRASMTPSEIADTTLRMAHLGLVEGLFLSSGIGGNVREIMTQIVDTARILREKMLFGGYIHLKILPGASIDLIEAAGRYADRLSINMEAPSETALRDIAPNKGIKEGILKQMQWIETLRKKGSIPLRVGQTTQFVVGGSDDPGANDRALIMAGNYLYSELGFRRIYYSAFEPIPGTPLEDREPENPKRSFRLYQADRLLALYGFKPDEFIFTDNGRLDLESDPKESWARAHRDIFPIDITKCEPTDLLRIPGIGPVMAKRILAARAECSLKTVDDFLGLGKVARKSLEYILVNGRAGEVKSKKAAGWKAPQLVLPFGSAVASEDGDSYLLSEDASKEAVPTFS